MFCPEDGAHILYNGLTVRDTGGAVYYGPCPNCDVFWVYDAEQGVYMPCKHRDMLEPIVDALKAAGVAHRQTGKDARVAHTLNMLERSANLEGKATYITGLESGLVVKSLPCGCCFIYHAYEGIDKLRVSHDCALQLLAESKHHD